jgi:hypothetical protein
MLDKYLKVDSATRKKLPVHSDVPELLVETAYQHGRTQLQQATVDLTMIVFYYLLRVGEYTIKGSRNNTKQTVQFKYEDITFLQKEQPRRAPMPSAGCTCTSHLICRQGHIKIGQPEEALKAAATVLEYPTTKGIPIDRIDTHSLRSGGANALSLSG